MIDELYKLKKDGSIVAQNNMFKPHWVQPLPTFIISELNNTASVAAMRACYQSIVSTDSRLSTYVIPATTPQTLSETMLIYNFSVADWKYPIHPGEKKIDIATGLHLTGYGAKDIRKVMSCLFSHMRCWTRVMKFDTPSLILEHDALFVRQFNLTIDDISKTGHDFIGINDPRGATRKSHVFLDRVLSQTKEGQQFYNCPWVDEDKNAPQGLAGHSAYIITPNGARRLLDKTREIGLWPNDALMCKQFFPDLKVAYPFYTKVQGIKSTTQG